MEFLVNEKIPCVVFEDDHLLVVNKPAGLNTHSPSPYAGEGLYDWLKNRRPRWADLAIIHRLDKETSGLIVFGKSTAANRSLTAQFSEHTVRKNYSLLTDRPVAFEKLTAKSSLVRAGEKYLSRPVHPGGSAAETRFLLPGRTSERRVTRVPNSLLIEAEPITGKTHQIRVHAAEHGFPILGDTLYGGTPAPRVYLCARSLAFQHPVTDKEMKLEIDPDFSLDPRRTLRRTLIDPDATNAYRLVHGASDGWPGWYVDRFGDFLLSQSETSLTAEQKKFLETYLDENGLRGAYHKILNRRVQQTAREELSLKHVLGESAPEEFSIVENGIRFAIRFDEGYSVGLFLDQRDNRRRWLTRHVAAHFPIPGSANLEVLNAFSYTCGFSVGAARAGAQVTSLDLSKKYLEWGRHNFV